MRIYTALRDFPGFSNVLWYMMINVDFCCCCTNCMCCVGLSMFCPSLESLFETGSICCLLCVVRELRNNAWHHARKKTYELRVLNTIVEHFTLLAWHIPWHIPFVVLTHNIRFLYSGSHRLRRIQLPSRPLDHHVITRLVYHAGWGPQSIARVQLP